MTKITAFRNIYINLGIILFFIVLAYAYMFPLLEGKALRMDDVEHFRGMSKELADYREQTGEEAVWTNSMFSGMPGYLISVNYPGNLGRKLSVFIRKTFSTASFIILYLVGFYILLSSLKINRWLRVAGAVAFAFSSYFLIIIGAGHMTKANAIAWLAPTIGGVLLAFRGKPLAGGLLFAAALSMELLSGHLQITYYGIIILVILGITELVFATREKMLPLFFKALLFLFAGAVLAVGMNFSRLYTTWEYSKDTIRGATELTSDSENRTSGLDKDYVVQWSYGIDETLTLLIPNFKGGGSQIHPGIRSESFQILQQQGVQNPRQTIQAVSMYHGDQPGTSGPVYAGAIVIFLFVLGIFVVKGRMKWWLVSATLVSIVLSWGSNVMWLTGFLLDYLPLYNKFRAPSMTLVIAEFTIPLLGIIALNEILTGRVDKKIWLSGFKWAIIITGGLSLLLAVFPGISGNFTNAYDSMRFPDWLMPGVVADRKNMLRTDAFRSFLFIAITAGLIYLWYIKKLRTTPLIALISVLILVDLWSVDKRYLNSDSFISKRQAENPFPETVADRAILADNDLYYRVLPLQNPFQDARTSYYHKNVGGYHAAKLRRYQELIEHHLQPEIEQMVTSIQASSTLDAVDSAFMELPVINMLNTRYIIYDLNSAPIRNPHPLGNAWFVADFKIVGNADDEILAMKNFNPSETAIVDQRFISHIHEVNLTKETGGKIELTEYQPNYLKYEYSASSARFTVFSDIYYNKGWNAYIDGEPVSHFRVNYVLRALIVPEGKHTIEFKFEPKSYYTGNKISLASSLLLVLATLGYVFSLWRKRKIQSEKE